MDKVKLSDIRAKFPEYNDLSDDQLLIGVRKKFYADIPMSEFVKRVEYTAPNPTDGMSGVKKFAAGMGSFITDTALGAKQLLAPNDPALQRQVAEKQAIDKPLANTGAGAAGKLTAALVPAVATSFLPGVNTVTGSAAVGAGLGLLEPTTQGAEGKLWNAGVGGVFGAAGQGIANAVGRAVSPVKNALNPEQARLAAVAQRENIPLDAAALTGSKPLQTMNSVFANLPLTAGPEAARQEATKQAFNRAVLQRAGISADSATPDVLAVQKKALGRTFEDIAGRNAIDFNQGSVMQELTDIATQAQRRLAQPGPIVNTVDDILADAASGSMPGLKYQGWRETLRTMAAGNDTQAKLAADVKKALDRAFSAQISGADAQAWQQASRQYGNLKTISQAMGGAGNEAASGNVPAAQLAAALRNSVSREGNALGRGDLNDLARVGQLFVRDNVPNSGTAQRQLIQSLLTGGGAGGASLMFGADPTTALAIGAGSAAGPRVAQAVVNSPAVQRYLTSGVQNQSALALAEALRRSAPAAAIGYAAQE